MPDLRPAADLLRTGTVDAELGGLLWLLLEARTPLVAVGSPGAADRVVDGLICLLPAAARVHAVAPDDDFAWLPEAARLGWRPDRPQDAGTPAGHSTIQASPEDGVLLVRGLAAPAGVADGRARLVVRALALGYGLLATMGGEGLDDALEALHDASVATDPDERSRLGIVLAVGGERARPLVTAAHYVRPVALDTHGHVQRPAPAVLATWNAAGSRFDHFAWGVLPDLAGRAGMTPGAFEREQAQRASVLAELARNAPA